MEAVAVLDNDHELSLSICGPSNVSNQQVHGYSVLLSYRWGVGVSSGVVSVNSCLQDLLKASLLDVEFGSR